MKGANGQMAQDLLGPCLRLDYPVELKPEGNLQAALGLVRTRWWVFIWRTEQSDFDLCKLTLPDGDTETRVIIQAVRLLWTELRKTWSYRSGDVIFF